MKKTIVWMCVLLSASFAAYAKSISVCFGGTGLEAKDDLAGLEAVPARNWMNVTSAGSAGTIPTASVATTFKDDQGATLSGMALFVCSRGGNYQNGYTASQTERLIYGYLDDDAATAAGFKVTGIPYSSYKVIIYRGTDLGTANPFGPHTINDTVYSYTNGTLTAGLSQGWGIAHKSKLLEGENAMVVGPLSGDLTVLTTRLSGTCRACISGFQIVDLSVPDYQATVSGDANWSSLTWVPAVADWNALPANSAARISVSVDATVTNDVVMNPYRTILEGPAKVTLTKAGAVSHMVPFLNVNSGTAIVNEGPFYSNIVVSANTTSTVHMSAFRYLGGAGTTFITGGNYDFPRTNSFPCTIGLNTPDTITYYAAAANTAQPAPKFAGDGTLTLQFEISNVSPLASPVDMSEFTGTLRVVNTNYRARVSPGAVMTTAFSLPQGATLVLSTNTQLYCTAAFTCNADIEFEDGAEPNHTWVDGNGAIGQLRLNAVSTFNGAIRVGTGSVRIGSDNTAGINYYFNGPISGNILELGAMGYGNNCVYNLNGNNSQALTRIMDIGRNVIVKANTATALGDHLSFVTNSLGMSVINISNGVNVAVQTLNGTNINSTIAFLAANSQFSVTGSGSSLYKGRFAGAGILAKSGTGTLDLQMQDFSPLGGLTVTSGALIISNTLLRVLNVGDLDFTGGTISMRGNQQFMGTSFTGGTGTLHVDVAGLNPGTYTLIAVPGNVFASSDFASVALLNENTELTYAVAYETGAVNIVIGGVKAWNGGADGTWETSNSEWTLGESGVTYTNGDHVSFGQLVDIAQATNTLEEVIHPGSVTFDSGNTTWTLKTNPGATGTITNGDFIVTSGTVILADTNVLRSFTGVIKINGGTLDATLSNAIPSTCTIQLTAPGTLRTSTYIPVAQLQNISGDLVFAGTSTNAWGAISTVGGARLIVESGILKGTHNDSFGSRNNLENLVSVKAGGAIDLNGISRNNASRWMTATLAGTGWSNSGAIFNSSVTAVNENCGVRNIILSGNATVAVRQGRLDIGRENSSTYIDYNGFTLTKTGTADSYFRIDEVRNPGSVVIEQGLFGFCGFSIGDTASMPITVQPGATLGNYLAGNIYSPLTFNSQVGGAVTNYAIWKAYDNNNPGNIIWRGSVTLNPTVKLNANFVNIGNVSQFQSAGYLTLGSATANSGLRLPNGATSFGYPLYTEVADGHIDIGTNIVEMTSTVTGTSQLVLRGAGICKWNGTAAGFANNLRLLAGSGIRFQLMKDFDGPTILLDTGTTLSSDSSTPRAVIGAVTTGSANAVNLGDTLNNGLLTFGQITTPGGYNLIFNLNSDVTVTKLTFGGYGATFTVASDVDLVFNEVNSNVNQGQTLIKNGLGRMLIKSATGGFSKHIALNGGTLEFNNASGVAYGYAGTVTAAPETTFEKSGADLITFSGASTVLSTLLLPAQEISGLAITSATFLCNRIQLSNGGSLNTSTSYILLNGGTLRSSIPQTVEPPLDWYAANSGANLTLTYRTDRPFTLAWNGGTGNWSLSETSLDWLKGLAATNFVNNDSVRLGTQVGAAATVTVLDTISVPAITIDGTNTAYTLAGTSPLYASSAYVSEGASLAVSNLNVQFNVTDIGATALLTAPGSLLLNPPGGSGTLRLSSDYAFANNGNYTAGTIEAPAGLTFTYTGSVNAQTRPFVALKGAGTNRIVTTITDLDFGAAGGSSAQLTGTLAITGPYRSRVRGNLLSFATSLPAGSTLWVGNTMQLYNPGGATYNANLVFEDGAAPESTWLDTGNYIGTIRVDGNGVFNGKINAGSGRIVVGSSGNDRIYTLNGVISGNTIQLGTVGWGTRYTYNMNGNNLHEKTLVNVAGRISLANIGHAKALGKTLEFTGNAALGTVNLSNNVAAVIETLSSPTTASVNYRINFTNSTTSLAISNGTYFGLFSGAGNLIKNSTDLLTLGNTNNHTVTTLNGGTLVLAHTNALGNTARLTGTAGTWIAGTGLTIGNMLMMPTNLSGTVSFKLYMQKVGDVITSDRIGLKTGAVIPATSVKFAIYKPDGNPYTKIADFVVAQYAGATAPSTATWVSALPEVPVSFITDTVNKVIIMSWMPVQDGTMILLR